MKIAFYAPMKPVDDPTPSGDRQMALALIRALEGTGHEVRIASRFRSWCRAGGEDALHALADRARTEADVIARKWQDEGYRPDLILTYHVYHKAPDWIGPALSRATGAGYMIVEGARALKQESGPWAVGFAAADAAFDHAGAVVAIHAEDAEGLAPVVPPERLWLLPPFIDTKAFREAAQTRIAADEPRLLTVAMMRDGDKRASYEILARALGRLQDRPWRLTVAGDGPAGEAIRALFPVERTRFLGQIAPGGMPEIYAEADLFVWPAVNEAYGLVLLEAQAAGLPVIAGRTGGVPDIVADGETGLLTPEGDDAGFALALSELLDDPDRRIRMGKAAAQKAENEHDLQSAQSRLQAIIEAALAMHRQRSGSGGNAP
ncbi:MAG TPA: glycosyltransferase family 4 protein [Afifellaceae bacterium]|nr:glycosyltransferase family 4 protein [Afifellaceae bacterium]